MKMRKRYMSALVGLTLASAVIFTSCIGSFSMTKKLIAWNNQVGNNFVNELVFFAFWILPVYEVSALADLFVLNSIEFWSGTNPIAKGESKVIEGHEGRYLVEIDEEGYTITSEDDGSVVRLDFDEEENSWTVVTPAGEEYRLMTIVDESHVRLPSADGGTVEVELSSMGVANYSSIALRQLYACE